MKAVSVFVQAANRRQNDITNNLQSFVNDSIQDSHEY